MFCVYVSGLHGSLNRHSYTWKKNSQDLQDDDRVSHVGYQESTCRSWHPSLLPGSHVVSYFDSTFLSWVVYCGYTRPRGCLLSALLTQMWPGTVTVTVYEQRVTKKLEVLTKSIIVLFLCLISRLSTWTSFKCPYITFMVYIYCPILNLYFR